jgi:hypothetical protein
MARAAFAQGTAALPPTDTTITRLAIYPALGISRVGNSQEWFLAPEVPGLPALPDGRYKDGEQRVKKQVQRFRVYGFNQAGEVVREITAAEARIAWTVHVANTKAAWYGFNNPLDNGELAPGLPGWKRNQFFTDDVQRAAMLVINPGPKSIAGVNTNATGGDHAYDMAGRFWQKLDVKLGHLRTDEHGRLLVFPGDGTSRSAVPDDRSATSPTTTAGTMTGAMGWSRPGSRSPPVRPWRLNTPGWPVVAPTSRPTSRPLSRSMMSLQRSIL